VALHNKPKRRLPPLRDTEQDKITESTTQRLSRRGCKDTQSVWEIHGSESGGRAGHETA